MHISILNSKEKSSSWFSKRFCYEINTLLNYINISIPSVRILKVEIWSWINQFLCHSHVANLNCQDQSSSVIMNSFRWKISHCKEYMIDATDRQMEGQTSNLRLLNDQWSLWWLPNEGWEIFTYFPSGPLMSKLAPASIKYWTNSISSFWTAIYRGVTNKIAFLYPCL